MEKDISGGGEILMGGTRHGSTGVLGRGRTPSNEFRGVHFAKFVARLLEKCSKANENVQIFACGEH